MTTSKVEIWNLALTYIGHENFIVSATENSTERAFCERFWNSLLDTALSMFDWTFANKRVFLPLIYDASTDYKLDEFDVPVVPQVLLPNKIPDFQYMYGYPSDCLKANYIIPGQIYNQDFDNIQFQTDYQSNPLLVNREARIKVPYQVKLYQDDQQPAQDKKVIITDEKEAKLDYVARISDPSLMSPLFVQLMALMIARPLVAALAKDGKRLSAINDMYNDTIALAQVQDANQDNEDQIPANSEFLGAR